MSGIAAAALTRTRYSECWSTVSTYNDRNIRDAISQYTYGESEREGGKARQRDKCKEHIYEVHLIYIISLKNKSQISEQKADDRKVETAKLLLYLIWSRLGAIRATERDE